MPLFIAPTLPTILSVEPASFQGRNTYTATKVYVYAFEVNNAITIIKARCNTGATAAGTVNMGIYTFAGNLVPGSDTGAVSVIINSDVTFTYPTPFTLLPGQYYMAISPSSSTDNYLGYANVTNATYRARLATNVTSGGALPATLGAIGSTFNIPAVSFILQNGLA